MYYLFKVTINYNSDKMNIVFEKTVSDTFIKDNIFDGFHFSNVLYNSWYNFGYTWYKNIYIIINLPKYEKAFLQNNLRHLWKQHLTPDNLKKIIRQQKMKNI